jgi:alanine racemase
MSGAVVIDLDAVRQNVAVLCERAAPAAVLAVVKADAYGHGLLPCARAALAGGATWLGVAQLDEAMTLRRAGITAPLLAWLTVPGQDYAAAVRADIDLGVSTSWALREIAAAARGTGHPARLHLKIDTGLSRNGVTLADWPDLLDAAAKAQADGAVRLAGAFSHYAWADAPEHPTVTAQTAAFHAALALAADRGVRFEIRHLANSAATLTNPDAHLDLVRPGLAIYGLSPVPELASPADLGLRPAMSLLGAVSSVKRVPAGAGVSYGHAYTTPRDTWLALIPLGYADGVPRHAGNTGPVQLGGRRHRVAGRVCMDQIVVDLGAGPDGLPRDLPDAGRSGAVAGDTTPGYGVRPGDVAVLFGPGDAGEPTAEDWAVAAGTISYEIVARIGSRLPRIYLPIRDGDQHGPAMAAPARTSAAPARTSAAPARSTAAPARTTAAPARTTAAPARTSAAPARTKGTAGPAEPPGTTTDLAGG